MNFKAILVLDILNEDQTKAVRGSKELTFPFPPYRGLEITSDWGCSYTLEHVTWAIEEERFHCLIVERENYDTDDGLLDSPIDMGFLIDEARKFGFEGFDKVMDLTHNK